jgi:hypothetical protein
MTLSSNLSYTWVPLETAQALYEQNYDGEIDLYKGLEQAFMCVKKHIGLFRTDTCVLEATPQNGVLPLPAGVFRLESVRTVPAGSLRSLVPPSALLTYGLSFPAVEGVSYNTLPEVYSLSADAMASAANTGAYVPFSFRGDHLHVETDAPVLVVYKTLVCDSEYGYPYITEKSADACAAYFHKLEISRKYYRKEVGLEMKREADSDFEDAAAEARRGEGFSENSMDEILSALSRFDRKRHDLPYHPRLGGAQ